MHISERLKLVLQDVAISGRLDSESFNGLAEEEKELVYTLYNEGLVAEALNLLNDMDVDMEWNHIRKKMVSIKKPAIPIWKPILKYAAIFLCLFSIVYFFRTEDRDGLPKQVSETSIKLKIGNDAIKVINEGENQQIISASGIVVAEQKGNKIRYNSNADIDELVYNELEIPYGKIFNRSEERRVGKECSSRCSHDKCEKRRELRR